MLPSVSKGDLWYSISSSNNEYVAIYHNTGARDYTASNAFINIQSNYLKMSSNTNYPWAERSTFEKEMIDLPIELRTWTGVHWTNSGDKSLYDRDEESEDAPRLKSAENDLIAHMVVHASGFNTNTDVYVSETQVKTYVDNIYKISSYTQRVTELQKASGYMSGIKLTTGDYGDGWYDNVSWHTNHPTWP